jgi:Flp pilus assembly protein TadG
MTFLFVGVGLAGFMAATTLAVDIGMFMTARSQAQNAADAGALAGAVALVYDDYDDRSASGPVVQSAVNTALENIVIGAPVSVGPADVTFPLAPGGASNRVRVSVYRTTDRTNALPTLMGALFGIETIDIEASATAEASPANAMTCVKPFTIPDRWSESSGSWTTASSFERYDNKGNLLPNPDEYIPFGQSGYRGYDPVHNVNDRGLRLTLRAGSGNNIMPTFYYSWKMPGPIGADYYRENIEDCNSTIVHRRDLITQEPGNMMGPTIDGIRTLIDRDPTAYWDESARKVVTDMHPSPRVFPIPLYDPEYYATGKANGRNADLRVANWVGFFVESASSNEVYGRVTPITGIIDPAVPALPDGPGPIAIRLVQ